MNQKKLMFGFYKKRVFVSEGREMSLRIEDEREKKALYFTNMWIEKYGEDYVCTGAYCVFKSTWI